MKRWDGFTRNDDPSSAVRRLQGFLPPLTFITVHYAYFIVVCLIASLVFWGSSSPDFRVSYVDSLFVVVSAMTESGLNTVNLSQLNTWQQVILFLLIMFGGSIWVSIWTVLARKRAFEKRFDDIVAAARSRRPPSAASNGRPFLDCFMPLAKVRSTLSLDGRGATSTSASRGLLSRFGGKGDSELAAGTSAAVRSAVSLPETAKAGPTALEATSVQGPAEGAHIVFADGLEQRARGDGVMGSSYPAPLRRRPVRQTDPAPEQTPEKGGNLQPRSLREFLDNTPGTRNGQFHDLTSEERDQLGGCEYRALKVLAVIVPLYFVLWQLLGSIALGAWISMNLPEPALQNGISPWWLGVFNSASAFNNSGMSLLDANVIPFQQAYFVLITMALMILAGNTAYPILLRLILWTGLKLLKLTTAETAFTDLKATLEFILRYPRRVYTNLFPSRPTWWLLFMVVLLNSIDWVAFELLNLGNPIIEDIPKGARVLDGFFQATAVRSGGFYVIPIAQAYIGLQILYVIMMYISVYPVVITMRHSNVYEERSLGIYAGEQTTASDLEVATSNASAPLLPHSATPNPDAEKRSPGQELGHALRQTFTPWHGVGALAPNRPGDEQNQYQNQQHQQQPSHISFISQQIHGQLAHDIWLIVLAVLVISTIETGNFLSDPVAYSIFNVIFEVVSAYGCVGISVGVPFDSFSFSGGWHASSKLVLCLVMIRGRHRGLPVALDHAVRLPGEQLDIDEEEDHRIRRSMTATRRASIVA